MQTHTGEWTSSSSSHRPHPSVMTLTQQTLFHKELKRLNPDTQYNVQVFDYISRVESVSQLLYWSDISNFIAHPDSWPWASIFGDFLDGVIITEKGDNKPKIIYRWMVFTDQSDPLRVVPRRVHSLISEIEDTIH